MQHDDLGSEISKIVKIMERLSSAEVSVEHRGCVLPPKRVERRYTSVHLGHSVTSDSL